VAGASAAEDDCDVVGKGRHLVGSVTVAALALAVAGCDVGDIRRPPPAATSEPTVGAQVVRDVRVPVPVGYDRRQVEFTTAGHGYAMFVGCHTAATTAAATTAAAGCTAVLLSTLDAGRTWRLLTHPQPLAREHRLYARGPRLVLLAEPGGWYVSTDRGATFRHYPIGAEAPIGFQTLAGRFQTCCPGRGALQVMEWVDGRSRPTRAQPAVPGLSAVAYADGRLVAAGLRSGLPYAAVSLDAGATWRTTRVPPPAEPVSALRLEVGGGDAWLVGYAADRTLFPYLWRAGRDGEWEAVAAAGHPSRIRAVAAIGERQLAVAGPEGVGLVGDGRYRRLDWPVGDDLRVLSDGVLMSVDPGGPDLVIWLGPGRGADRRWIRLVLRPGLG